MHGRTKYIYQQKQAHEETKGNISKREATESHRLFKHGPRPDAWVGKEKFIGHCNTALVALEDHAKSRCNLGITVYIKRIK